MACQNRRHKPLFDWIERLRMKMSVDVIEAAPVDGLAESISTCDCSRRSWFRQPMRLMLLFAGGGITVFIAVERIGTTANASAIEFTTNYGGGFLAIGLTDHDPGFVVLSAIDQEHVDVSAEQSSSLAVGTRTRAEVHTPQQRWSTRLRSPQVVIVNDDGTVIGRDVQWGFEDFARIRAATDCLHESAKKRHRCGAPFTDFNDLVTSGALKHVPDEVRVFLKRHEEP
ncbi:MAG: hypothetical protein HS101_11660 [Planctomycetia bacterium]|nr:hypothetical protein [Planctomycetia bacterium]MCC7314692.1 hypothetical protein [Planctomycetota bacterium]